MRRLWLSSRFSTRPTDRRPAFRPNLVRLEERTTPSTLNLVGGILTFTGTNVDNALTVSFDGTDLKFVNPLDPMTAIPAGFTDVNADGKTVTGPIAGVTVLGVTFGTQTSQLNVGPIAADLGAVIFQANTTGTASLDVTAGGTGLKATGGSVFVTGFQQVTLNNTLAADGVSLFGQTIVVNQPIASVNTLVLNGYSITTAAELSTQGDLSISGGKVAIGNDITATGNITVFAVDTAAAGEDFTLAAGAQIVAGGDTVAIQVADGLVLGAGALVQSTGGAGKIEFLVDTATDPEGGTANTVGADLKAKVGAFLTGDVHDDTFIVSGTTDALLVDGKGGTNSHTFDAEGTTPVTTASTAQTPGKAVTTFANPAAYNLINLPPPPPPGTVDGTNGNDVFEVVRIGGVNKYRINGGAFTDIVDPLLSFDGKGGADRLIVDYSGGDPVPVDGITFDGGGDPDDGVAILGTGGQVAVYRPDATNSGAGVVTVDGKTIAFSKLTPLDLTGMASVTLDLPNADDVVDVAAGIDFLSGGNQALRLTGSSGGVVFESVAVWNTASLVVDTTAQDGKDKVTLTSANNAHGVTNFKVLTGGNTGDTVTATGILAFAGTADVKTGGSIGVTGKITAGQDLILTTEDAPATGQNITLFAGSQATSSTGLVTISAGDNLTVGIGAQVAGAAAINMAVDTGGGVDAAGGTATLTSAVLLTPVANLFGSVNDDAFTVSGYTVGLAVDGKDGTDTVTFAGTAGTVAVTGVTITRAGKLAVTAANVEALAVTDATVATFTGAVSYPHSITVTAGSTVAADGAAIGSGALTFTNTLGFPTGNATFTATTFVAAGTGGLSVTAGKTTTINAAGAAMFNTTADGPGALVVNAGGVTTFAKNVGAGTALAALATGNPAGGTAFQGGLVRTTGDQSFAGDVTVAAVNTFQSLNGSVQFGGKLDGAAADTGGVVVNAATGVTFVGPVGGTNRLTTLTSKVATTVSGGLVNTRDDQIFFGPVTYTSDGTKFASAAGPLAFVGALDAVTTGDKDLIATGGTGSVIFLGAIGGAGSPRNLAVSGNLISAGQTVTVTDRADFTVGSGGMSQGAGPILAAGIGLFGTGNFDLGTTVNNVGPLGLRVNLTGPGAAVAFTDVNQLLVDNSSPAAGIKTAGGNVTLKSGGDFRAEIPLAAPLDTVMIDLGTGKLAVFPGLAGKARIVFNAEVVAGAVTLGTAGPVDTNAGADAFSVRPSKNVQITVNGNAPFAVPGDALSVITFGTNLVAFTLDPVDQTNGQYTFDTRFPIVFTSIEQFGGLQADGFVVQVNDPVTADFRMFAVRFTVSFRGDQGPGVPRVSGSATPANTFIVSPQLRSQSGPFTPPQIAFGDVNGDGVPDFIFANGQDSPPLVTAIDGRFAFALAGKLLDLSNLDPSSILVQYQAFEPTFLGGVSLAVGDLDGDGTAEIVTGAGVGGAPRVRVVGYTGNPDPFQAAVTRADFFGYEPTFRGGVNVAVGDTTADGSADLFLGTGFGGGPRVRILDGTTFATRQDFFAYEPTFRGGVFVGAGQFDADGKADVVTGPGFGGGSRVRVFSGVDLTSLADFFAFPTSAGVIGGDNAAQFGVGGVAFGRLIANSGSQQAILVATPRGLDAQALAFSYHPVTLQVRTNATDAAPAGVAPPFDQTLRPAYLPGGVAEITPDVRSLRDSVSVAGFVSPII